MEARYGLNYTTSIYSPVFCDPILTPIFTAILGSFGTMQIFGVTVAQIASAIAVTADAISSRIVHRFPARRAAPILIADKPVMLPKVFQRVIEREAANAS